MLSVYVFIKATLKFVDSKIVLSIYHAKNPFSNQKENPKKMSIPILIFFFLDKINYINLSKGFIELN